MIYALSGAIVAFTLKNNAAGATIVDSDTTTDASGQAWVKINSSAPGSVEIHASTTVEVGGITLTRATDGNGQNSGNAKKIYVTTGIKIEKSTNAEDADTPPGPVVAKDSRVDWSYKVTNTGDTPISDVVVTDDNGTPLDPSDDLHPTGPTGDNGNHVLDPNETWTYTAHGTAIVGQYENIATVTGQPSVGGQVTSSDFSHYFGAAPGIEIIKDGPATVNIGGTITYDITVSNTGNVTLHNVLLNDTKLGIVNQNLGDIAVGGSVTIHPTYGPVTEDDLPGPIENTATATSDEAGPVDNSHSVDIVTAPGITIDKSTNGQDADTAPGPSLTVGDPITWTYVVSNTGNVTLTNITVTDSDLGPVGTISSLAPGASQTLTMTGTAVSGQYANTGTASVTFGGTTYTDSDDSHYVGVGADLSLTKSVDNADPNEGDTIVYTITLTNGGPSKATDVQVTDALPTGLTYMSDNGAGAYDPGTGIWTVANLTSGSSTSLAITATVNTGTAGSTLTNTAEVTASDQPDPDSTPNNHNPDEDDQSSIDITVQSADLAVTKIVDNATPSEGDTIVYTITLTNNGPSDATSVALTDLLPVGVTYVSDDSSGAYDPFTGVWNVGGLLSGEIATLNITATVDAGTAGTTITNAVEVTTSDQPDPDTTNNRDTADITVAKGPAGGGGGTKNPCEGKVIINEVAWAGTAASSQDQWIELRNLGTIPVDLSGWTLRWRRKKPTTAEERRWKTVDLSGVVLPAETSACDLAKKPQTASVTLVKTNFDAVSWQVVTEQPKKDESFYTLERLSDNTISNAKANLVYDTSKPHRLALDNLGDVIELLNADGEVVDTANAFDYPSDGWPAGDAATHATMERTNPLGPDTADNWHTNLGIITHGEDADHNPLIATADAPNSDILDKLSLNPDVPPAKTRAGARLEVGLEVTQQERRAYGWPWVRVTQPERVASAGGGGMAAQGSGAGFSFSGRYTNGVYWLGIDTAKLAPGRYNVWIVYGGGKTVLVPIEVLP